MNAKKISQLNDAAQVEFLLYLLDLQRQQEQNHHDSDIKKLAPAHHGKS